MTSLCHWNQHLCCLECSIAIHLREASSSGCQEHALITLRTIARPSLLWSVHVQATVYDDQHMGDYVGVVVQYTNVATKYNPGGVSSSVGWEYDHRN